MLATKLYVPQPQPTAVVRPRLIERLNEGLHRKLTLISAPAGFGKTTVVSEWVAGCGRPVAWLSLDEGDSDPTRFMAYLVAALQTVAANIGSGVLGALQSPQPPPIASTLTALLNDIVTIPDAFVLILDDYHVVDAQSVDEALSFLIEHLPPRMHLAITTREDPRMPLARLRARGQLTELRASDLRFNPSEAAEFLNRAMGLDLSHEAVAALETRTEGWIAGLQLAAISMRGIEDTTSFITSFTGSHRFVLDYLVEEVLQQQSEPVHEFLLRTSILDRLSGPLCDAVVLDPCVSGQETLEYLEHANLFLVPLDNQRRWYRYHHLFAELLRQRLHQSIDVATGTAEHSIAELHLRASGWFEEHGLELEAFQHATAANDVERAERLIDGRGMPLYLRGVVAPVLGWLETLPDPVLDASPSLRVMYATVLAIAGYPSRAEPKLLAAEAVLGNVTSEENRRNLVGRIAGIRSLLALLSGDPSQMETVIVQAQRALEFLAPDNLRERCGTIWRLGLAHQYLGNRDEARRIFSEAVEASERAGNTHVLILATTGLGRLQEAGNDLHRAAETYRQVLRLVGEPPWAVACEAHVGLARIFYEWNDLDAAHPHGLQSVTLARQIELTNFISCELFLARLLLARGDVHSAVAALAATEQSVRQRNLSFRMPDVAAVQVLALLRQGQLADAALLAQTYELPISQARVHLAQGDAVAALAALDPWRQRVEAKGWQEERLRVIVLQAVAYHASGDTQTSVRLLDEALDLAEPGGYIRLFLDEGVSMAQLLSEAIARGVRPEHAGRILAVFGAEGTTSEHKLVQPPSRPTKSLVEPLSQRELVVLRLLATDLDGPEIARELNISLNTLRTHSKNIYSKLGVTNRRAAISRAGELDLLSPTRRH
jgi:LuxR family maltose regulon positive regulatory protein